MTNCYVTSIGGRGALYEFDFENITLTMIGEDVPYTHHTIGGGFGYMGCNIKFDIIDELKDMFNWIDNINTLFNNSSKGL